MTVVLHEEKDWRDVVGKKCGVIIDAMTYRAAELFFVGRKQALKNSETDDIQAVWKAISENIGAVQTFLDSLILHEKMPMIDYDITFPPPDPHPGETRSLLNMCNENEEILLDVQVTAPAYIPLKKAAIEMLNYERPELTNDLRNFVLPELTAFDYQWRPDLSQVEGFDRLKDQDKLLMTFLYGRLLFSGYAQAAEADEVFQPKLAKLHILSSVRHDQDRRRLQNRVFAGLREIAHSRKECIRDVREVPWMPTFLPYLLDQDPETPRDLLNAAAMLRKDPAVRQYRKWFSEIEKDFDNDREPSHDRMRQLEEIRQAVEKRTKTLKPQPITIRGYISVAFKKLLPEAEAGLQAEREIVPSRLWGWISRLLPGNKYRKLMIEIVDAERRYGKLDKQLRKIWSKTQT